MLSRLEQQGRPLVAEAEFPVPGGSDAENALRLRRIQFYIRNGFTPAYIMSTCGMVWQALLCGTVEPLENIMAQHKTLYGDVRTDVVIPLPEGQTPQPPYWDDLIKQRPAHAGRCCHRSTFSYCAAALRNVSTVPMP